jgi:hypothetical protein
LWFLFTPATNTSYIFTGHFQWEIGLPEDNTETNADTPSYIKQEFGFDLGQGPVNEVMNLRLT